MRWRREPLRDEGIRGFRWALEANGGRGWICRHGVNWLFAAVNADGIHTRGISTSERDARKHVEEWIA